MKFANFECSPEIISKLRAKHQVDLAEVQDVFGADPWIRRGPGDRYIVYGRTSAGRYLLVVVRDLGRGLCEIRTARDMTATEKRSYWRR
jgi:uncharacterized DUF497 family protein